MRHLVIAIVFFCLVNNALAMPNRQSTSRPMKKSAYFTSGYWGVKLKLIKPPSIKEAKRKIQAQYPYSMGRVELRKRLNQFYTNWYVSLPQFKKKLIRRQSNLLLQAAIRLAEHYAISEQKKLVKLLRTRIYPAFSLCATCNYLRVNFWHNSLPTSSQVGIIFIDDVPPKFMSRHRLIQIQLKIKSKFFAALLVLHEVAHYQRHLSGALHGTTFKRYVSEERVVMSQVDCPLVAHHFPRRYAIFMKIKQVKVPLFRKLASQHFSRESKTFIRYMGNAMMACWSIKKEGSYFKDLLKVLQMHNFYRK